MVSLRATYTAALLALAAAGPAVAQDGSSAAGSGTTGGSYDAPRPVVGSFACTAACAGISRVRAGSIVRLRGRNLENADRVLFLGRRGPSDDRIAAVVRKGPKLIEVRVPRGARSGRLRALDPAGQRSSPTRGILRMAPGGRAPALEARVSGGRVYSGARGTSLRYFVGGSAPARVAIELARPGEAPLARWEHHPIQAGTVGRFAWDGHIGGGPAPEGRYEFRVTSAPADGTGEEAHAAQAEPVAVAQFLYLRHRFPIAGPHSFGEEGARYGASRGGRAHDGHDVFAKCGTPLVAARGGTVKFVASHSRAGHYIVIDGDDSEFDYVYMHLRAPARFEKGDRVGTGQRIGEVGDTGSASACHLHFELWSSPGWYTGGSPVDPLPHLLEWERAGG